MKKEMYTDVEVVVLKGYTYLLKIIQVKYNGNSIFDQIMQSNIVWVAVNKDRRGNCNNLCVLRANFCKRFWSYLKYINVRRCLYRYRRKYYLFYSFEFEVGFCKLLSCNESERNKP